MQMQYVALNCRSVSVPLLQLAKVAVLECERFFPPAFLTAVCVATCCRRSALRESAMSRTLNLHGFAQRFAPFLLLLLLCLVAFSATAEERLAAGRVLEIGRAHV